MSEDRNAAIRQHLGPSAFAIGGIAASFFGVALVDSPYQPAGSALLIASIVLLGFSVVRL